MDHDKAKSSSRNSLELSGSNDSIVRRMLEHQTDKLFAKAKKLPKNILQKSSSSSHASLCSAGSESSSQVSSSPSRSVHSVSSSLAQSIKIRNQTGGPSIPHLYSRPIVFGHPMNNESMQPNVPVSERSMNPPYPPTETQQYSSISTAQTIDPALVKVTAVNAHIPFSPSAETPSPLQSKPLSITATSPLAKPGSAPSLPASPAIPQQATHPVHSTTLTKPKPTLYMVDTADELAHHSSPIVLHNVPEETIHPVDDIVFDQLSTDPSIDQAMLDSMHSIRHTPHHRRDVRSASPISSGASLRVKPMPAKYSLSESSGNDSLALRRLPSKEDIAFVYQPEPRLRPIRPGSSTGVVRMTSGGASVPERSVGPNRLRRLHRPSGEGWANWTGRPYYSDGESLALKPMGSKEDIGQAVHAGKGAKMQSASLDLGRFSRLSKKMSIGSGGGGGCGLVGRAYSMDRPRGKRYASPGSTLNEREVISLLLCFSFVVVFYVFNAFYY